MTAGRDDARILIYSHDSFGLGHLRRCRTIAHALVGAYDKMSVLISLRLSDHRQLRFSRPRRLRFASRGSSSCAMASTPRSKLHLDIEQSMELRGSIIQHTADVL